MKNCSIELYYNLSENIKLYVANKGLIILNIFKHRCTWSLNVFLLLLLLLFIIIIIYYYYLLLLLLLFLMLFIIVISSL